MYTKYIEIFLAVYPSGSRNIFPIYSFQKALNTIPYVPTNANPHTLHVINISIFDCYWKQD